MGFRQGLMRLMIFSALNLASMIPGGFVETRDFSAYSPVILIAFNVFLTALGLVCLMAVFMWSKKPWFYYLAGLVGGCFVVVYGLDLGQIFPVAPNVMSPLLKTLEWVGLALAITIMLISGLAAVSEMPKSNVSVSATSSRGLMVLLWGGIGGVAIVIIAYASYAAMGL